METITINIKSDLIPEFEKFIEKFGKDKIQIIDTNQLFISTKDELTKELLNYENGSISSFTIDEFDDILNQIIEKYEN